MIDKQRLALSDGVETVRVDIHYVVTWFEQPTKAAWWPFDPESGARVTCDVGYLCANFDLPSLLYSRLRPDVHDRQTDVRQHHHL